MALSFEYAFTYDEANYCFFYSGLILQVAFLGGRVKRHLHYQACDLE